jgi:hypothetical protein
MGLLRRTALLNSLNAYVSTLGGGRFLVRHIGHALALALLQARIARALGDAGCEARCWLHVSYSLLAAGRFRSARGLLAALAAAAQEHLPADETLALQVQAAQSTLRRTRMLLATGELQRTAPTHPLAARHDEYHRQRIVRVRSLDMWLQRSDSAAAARAQLLVAAGLSHKMLYAAGIPAGPGLACDPRA